MILLTQAQRDAVRGDYAAGRLEPVEVVTGLYQLPERLIARFPDAALGQYPTTQDLLASTKAHMLNQAATIRWGRCQLFAYDGVSAYAEPAVPSLTAKIRVLDESNDTTTQVSFKLNATVWRSWDLADLKACGSAIDAHIQGQFDHEADLAADIAAAGDIEALRAIDLEAGWP
ncbi:MAG: hypothetical protein CMH92_16335 [Oceanicaulis sp.]|nr:hypothetical protein [Oceanicaulis sp.]